MSVVISISSVGTAYAASYQTDSPIPNDLANDFVPETSEDNLSADEYEDILTEIKQNAVDAITPELKAEMAAYREQIAQFEAKLALHDSMRSLKEIFAVVGENSKRVLQYTAQFCIMQLWNINQIMMSFIRVNTTLYGVLNIGARF
jgi:hypothetical protein